MAAGGISCWVLPGFATRREIPGGSELLLQLEDLGKSGWETADFDGASKNADEFSERRARIALLRKMHRSRSKQMGHLRRLCRSLCLAREYPKGPSKGEAMAHSL